MGWAAVRSFEFWRPDAPPWVAAGLGELPGSCRFWSLACNVDALYTAVAWRDGCCWKGRQARQQQGRPRQGCERQAGPRPT